MVQVPDRGSEAISGGGGGGPASAVTPGEQTSRPLRVLVTGGLGFVGSAIVRALQEQHPEWLIWILDKNEDPRLGKGPSDQSDNDQLNLLKDCKYRYVGVDITDGCRVNEAFDLVRPDVVMHTAGFVPPLKERQVGSSGCVPGSLELLIVTAWSLSQAAAQVVPSFLYARRLEGFVRNINVDGTRHVVNSAKRNGCKALVYTSTCCVVTDDMSKSYANIDETWPVAERSSIYGESKAAAERIVLGANDLPSINSWTEHESSDNEVRNRLGSSRGCMFTCVLRPSVIFGEGDNQLIPPIHACIAKGESRYKIGHGRNLWDVTYVGNVADAHVLAAENLLYAHTHWKKAPTKLRGSSSGAETAAGGTFFIQNNEPVSFREFSLAVWKEFGHYPPVWEIHIPEALGWILGLFAEVLTRLSGTPTTLSRGSVMDACAMRYASGRKAERVLAYRPRVGLEEGIRRTCQDYAQRLDRRQME